MRKLLKKVIRIAHLNSILTAAERVYHASPFGANSDRMARDIKRIKKAKDKLKKL